MRRSRLGETGRLGPEQRRRGPTRLGALAAIAIVLLVAIALLLAMTGSAWATLEVDKWEAGTCVETSCKDSGPTSQFYTQAAGHPNFGITDFRFATRKLGIEHEEPTGKVKDVRVDLPPGLAVNPEATEQCSEAQLDEFKCPAGSQVGEDEAVGTASVFELLSLGLTVTEHFPVYDMQRREGQPARFGVAVNSSTLETLAKLGHDLRGHIYLEGGISWQHEPETSESSGVATGDYHEYFEIKDIKTEPEVIESKLIFWGIPQEHTHIGSPAAFITLPSTCTSKQITHLHVDSYEAPGSFLPYANETPVLATGCDQLAFDPTLSLTAEDSSSDRPDGVSADLHVPQRTHEPAEPDSPDVQSAQVTLPEGMTLDPSAANGLAACSDGQYAQGSCPGASQVGSVLVNAPGIPNGALAGGLYVGAPEPGAGPQSGGEYRVFLIASAPQYGVGLRLEGRVSADPQSGRLTATFTGAPQVPFEDFVIHLNSGPRAPLANPLACGPVAPSAAILPYTGQGPATPAASGFTVTGCASPLPFSLVQSLTPANPQAGAFSPFAFDLSRADGQQYLSRIAATLPPGLVAAIPTVALCGEAQANAGTCPASSRIGTVTVAAGAGSEPYSFTGQAFLTGPYGGGPYGLSIVVPAVAGPYDLGDVVTRAAISVGLYSGRVTVASTLPTIVGGVPLRLKGIHMSIDRPNFASNPTSCSLLATESALLSSSGAQDLLSSPFQATGCGGLAFKPKLTMKTGAKTSKPNGASLQVTIQQGAGQANIREVQVQLPKQLVARLSTLQKACPAATFETGAPPGACKSTARVGTVSAITPVLPGQLTGTAWLVSHGGAAFPDLDLVLTGDGVEVVLVGHTHIASSSITTSTFESVPDVPVSSVTVNLPTGPDSVLAAGVGRVCAASVLAPTTILAQNGAKVTQSTHVAVSGCPLVLLSHRIHRGRLILRVWAPEAGTVRVSGGALLRRVLSRHLSKAATTTIVVPLGPGAMRALRGRHGRKPKVSIAFLPRVGHNRSAVGLTLR